MMGLRTWIASDIAASALIHPKLRSALLRTTGATIGKARIMHGTTIGGDIRGLTIGDNVFINSGCSLHPTGRITIGADVSLGPRVTIMTGTHRIGPTEKRASNPTQYKPVSIEDGAWIGAGVIINPGVRIGRGCIVAPGAVVTRDCQADALYAGIPATFKRYLP